MGTDDIYSFDSINYKITSDLFNVYYTEDINKKYLEVFNEILSDVLIEFSDSDISLSHPNLFDLERRRSVIVKIFFYGTNKKTYLEYDIDAHEISGLVWMSLEDRDLTEMTIEEIEIIKRALLIWIYENI